MDLAMGLALRSIRPPACQPPMPARRLLLSLFVVIPGLAWSSPPAQAQRQVPKIGNICPLGYVDMLNGKCSTLGLMTYTVQPPRAKPAPRAG